MSELCRRQRLLPISIEEIDEDVRFRIDHQMEEVDTSSTPLAALGVYSSLIFDSSIYNSICGTVFADQNGTLTIKFSHDGLNFDSEDTVTYYLGVKYGFEIRPKSRYCQVDFTNGSVAQTVFRITIVGKY